MQLEGRDAFYPENNRELLTYVWNHFISREDMSVARRCVKGDECAYQLSEKEADGSQTMLACAVGLFMSDSFAAFVTRTPAGSVESLIRLISSGHLYEEAASRVSVAEFDAIILEMFALQGWLMSKCDILMRVQKWHDNTYNRTAEALVELASEFDINLTSVYEAWKSEIEHNKRTSDSST